MIAAVVIALGLLLAPGDMPVSVVEAPGCPVKLERPKILNTGDSPLVLLYAATNRSGQPLEQFTAMVFVYDRTGNLKARQVAPGRRSLDANETKFSTMVLDVGGIDANDVVIVGIDQAQRVDSDDWWRADLRPLAEAKATPPIKR
jgi:hypothetical protein